MGGIFLGIWWIGKRFFGILVAWKGIFLGTWQFGKGFFGNLAGWEELFWDPRSL